jgi:hypothetical protein
VVIEMRRVVRLRNQLLIVTLTIVALPGGALRPPPAIATHNPNHGSITSNGWSLEWEVSTTDGLIVRSASRGLQTVIYELSVPCAKVYYSSHSTRTDNLGNSGNVKFRELTKGSNADVLDLRAKYWQPGWPADGTYRYDVRYLFYTTNIIRTYIYVYGPGLEASARYEVYVRADMDLEGAANDKMAQYGTTAWSAPKTIEDPYRDDGNNSPSGPPALDPGNFEWDTWESTTAHGYFVDPRPDGSPDMYILRYVAGEGDPDMGTTCPALSTYDQNESINGHDIGHWYWSHTPCTRGSDCPGTCNTAKIIGATWWPSTGWV